MFGIKKIVKRLTEIEQKLGRLSNLVHSDERLVEQNKQLMDRIMAKSWGEYVSYKDSPDQPHPALPPHNPLTDENNAGEILNDEEIGQ